MPITSSLYVHDRFYDPATFEKNTELAEKCPEGFLGSFLNEFKRFSRQFISQYNNTTHDTEVMYTLISQYRGSYFPVSENARIEH